MFTIWINNMKNKFNEPHSSSLYLLKFGAILITIGICLFILREIIIGFISALFSGDKTGNLVEGSLVVEAIMASSFEEFVAINDSPGWLTVLPATVVEQFPIAGSHGMTVCSVTPKKISGFI